jgi:biotin transport system substrate-specific component
MTKNIQLRDLIYAALLAALTCVLSFVTIPLPISSVPITGQTLAVMLAGCVLTTRQAAFSMITFLLLGIIGLPVFAGGASGMPEIAGPRGGYLIGFLIGAIVISLLKGKNNNIVRLGIANVTGGIVAIYIFGVLRLSLYKGLGLHAAIVGGALPFIPGDILKVLIATFVGVAVNRQLKHIIPLKDSM